MKLGGGDAGHNGLRSITQHMTGAYWRVRMGIGHPGAKELVSPYVLSDFGKDERGWVEDLCDACAKRVPLLAAGEDGVPERCGDGYEGEGWGEKSEGEQNGELISCHRKSHVHAITSGRK